MATFEVTEENIQEFFDVALKLVQEAGVIVLNAIGSEKVVSTKSMETDVVTQTDQAVEKMLFDGLRKSFPSHKFIGEETTAASDNKIAEFTNDPTWIIDPIDGTMNFVHSHPMVSISVGFAINKRIQIGIVFAPVLDQMYTAIKGKGAKLNGKPIKVSGCTEMKNAMILMEVHARDGEKSEKIQLENIGKTISKVHSFRTIGSAAIDMALIASGSSDVFFHFGGLHCWDVVAGALLISEAGGYLCDPRDGKEFDYMSRYVLCAANKGLAEEILTLGLNTVELPKDFEEFCPL